MFDSTEKEINFINSAIVDFVVKLSDRRGLGSHDKLYLSTVYRLESLDELERANVIEEQIDDFTKRMEDSHIERLSKGICNANTGAQYMELSSNTERIADHLINVAKTIRNLRKA